jgi:hypothetical protein
MAVFAKKLAAEIGTSNAAWVARPGTQPAHDPPTALGPMAELEPVPPSVCFALLHGGSAAIYLFMSFIWVPLPFTFSFISVARFFDGGKSGRYEALGSWQKHASATSP